MTTADHPFAPAQAGRSLVTGWMVWAAAGLVAALAVAGVLLYGADLSAGYHEDAALLVQFPASVVFAIVGALILSRLPGHRIGWLCLAIGAAYVFSRLTSEYAARALLITDGGLPLGVASGWLSDAVGAGYWPMAALLLLNFPDGKPASRWWSYVGVVAIATGAAYFLLVGFARPYIETDAGNHLGANPLAVWTVSPTLVQISFNAAFGLLLVAAMSLVWRLRSATGVARQQLKMLVYVCALIIAVGLVIVPIYETNPNPRGGVLVLADVLWYVISALIILGVPVAIGVAISKYRLYDIDLIINRTLVYGSLTAILAGLYTALVTLAQRLFVALTGQKSDAAVVLTAFVVAALFTPLRDSLQRFVNRQVNPTNANAALDRLSETIDSVIAVLEGATIARRVLRDAVDGYRAQFGALYVDDLVIREGSSSGRACIEIPIQHEGRQLGRLVLGERGGAGYSSRDRETLHRSADAVARALVFADSSHRPTATTLDSKNGQSEPARQAREAR